MKLTSNPEVQTKFDNYPENIKEKMLQLRALILDTAKNIEGLEELEETLKWSEPSYLTKHGSTIRINWKTKTPNQYAIYCQCTSLLIPTFKTVYGNQLDFEGSRAIIFKIDEEFPKEEIKECIAIALTYHKRKKLPLLGM
ncbi:MAG: DUF1801 domain-containing protein [Chitinophagales bacterium]